MNDASPRAPLPQADIEQLLVAVEVIAAVTGCRCFDVLQALAARQIITREDVTTARIVLEAMVP